MIHRRFFLSFLFLKWTESLRLLWKPVWLIEKNSLKRSFSMTFPVIWRKICGPLFFTTNESFRPLWESIWLIDWKGFTQKTVAFKSFCNSLIFPLICVHYIQKSPSILIAPRWKSDKQPGTSVIDLFLVDGWKSQQTDTSKPIVMMIKQPS